MARICSDTLISCTFAHIHLKILSASVFPSFIPPFCCLIDEWTACLSPSWCFPFLLPFHLLQFLTIINLKTFSKLFLFFVGFTSIMILREDTFQLIGVASKFCLFFCLTALPNLHRPSFNPKWSHH